MKKPLKLRVILPVIALTALLVIVGFILSVTMPLLKQAGIPLTCVRAVYDLEVWNDLLCYTDSCDWIILRVSDDFVPPESWTQQTATLAEINPPSGERSRHYFRTSFLESPCLPDFFTVWLYLPHDDAVPFDEREWFAAMYDESSHVLALYRGHKLWGF